MSKVAVGKLLRDITVSHRDTLGEFNLVKVAFKNQLVHITGYDNCRGMHKLRANHDFLGKEGVDFEYAKTSTH